MSEQTMMLRLMFPGEQPTTAKAVVREWSGFERVKRTVLGLAVTWCAAGVAIFLPILHFVLVPGLLIAGPVVAIFRFTETRRIESIHGSCPRCKKERDYPHLGLRFNGKRSFTCDGCGNLIDLEQA